ncbi:MAG: DUF2889 domain-containing protein [Gammaproteobacteria bacterium]|nr:DUF2889 domain-containing protein [Gammaproteobacteria bacterium]MCY4274863.1 DUF2889 domain-containing protein [Gammaproteobacteria bacterium]
MISRKHLHTRSIQCHGYQRDDGLWDIEATLTDKKSYSISNHERGEIQPGDPIHNMTVCLTLDLDLIIRDIHIEMPSTPFLLCKSADDVMSRLVGLKIESGWMRRARELIARTESCTHVMELLGPISTAAYQTMHWAIEERQREQSERDTPAIIDQCKSLASNSAIVKVMWPEFHKSNLGNS